MEDLFWFNFLCGESKAQAYRKLENGMGQTSQAFVFKELSGFTWSLT